MTVLVGALMQTDTEFAAGMLSVISDVDGISFHAHHYCGVPFYWTQYKLDMLRSQTDLPLYLTETALIYDVDSEACEAEQADFARYLRTLDGLRVGIWYTCCSNGWRHSDLIRRGVLKPAYFAWAEGAR